MEAGNSKARSKSLRKLGGEMIRGPFKGVGALLVSASRDRDNQDSNFKSLASGSSRDVGQSSSETPILGNPTGAQHAQDAPIADFLTRSLDPDWIDIEMMGYWLRKCDAEHGESCRRPFGLDLSGLGQTNLLIDVQNNCLAIAKPGHRYACLSYVWGGAKTLKTGRSGLNDLMRKNSLEDRWEEIPQTIRHTIRLVAQLGIPYLWVDALCIVQDDIESKHDQIQAMAGIYANAYVTIIAGNGWDANHGLRGVQGVTEPRHLSAFLKSDFQENLQPHDSIWYSRGWTFQEMIFSPRKIMFQYQLAVWECNKASWNEASLSKITNPLNASSEITSISPWRSQINFSRWPDINQYVRLVQDYTKRKLTYSDDALHAISSLLVTMSFSFLGGFISGLPEMFFNEALLWQPKEPMQRRHCSERLKELPSWSWAGWEGEIEGFAWLQHWSHLYLYQTRTGHPALQVTSLVTWFYGNNLEERFPINVSGQTYIKTLVDRSIPLPPKWTPSSKWRKPSKKWSHPVYDQYVYDNQENTTSAYPLPVPSNQSPCIISARYLFCRATRAHFKSLEWAGSDLHATWWNLPQLSTLLQDNDGYLVGDLNLNLGLTGFSEPPKNTKYELVAISSGAVTLSAAVNYRFSVLQTPLRKRTPPVDVVDIYHVLWIEWTNGIAHRKGLGRVLKEAWDREATEEIDLILG
jgi:hypothetical protein